MDNLADSSSSPIHVPSLIEIAKWSRLLLDAGSFALPSKGSEQIDPLAILLDGIPVVAFSSNGYNAWRTYLSQAQSREAWAQRIRAILPAILTRPDVARILDIEQREYFPGYIIKDGVLIDCGHRLLYDWEHYHHRDDIEKMVTDERSIIPHAATLEDQSAIRFAFGRILYQLGKRQESANFACSLFTLAEGSLIKPALAQLCAVQGIALWAEVQAFNGDKLEAVLVALSSLLYFSQWNRFDSFLFATSIPILRKWVLADNEVPAHTKALILGSSLIENADRHHQVRLAVAQRDWPQVEVLTMPYVGAIDHVDWLSDITFFIQSVFFQSRIGDAYHCLQLYHGTLLPRCAHNPEGLRAYGLFSRITSLYALSNGDHAALAMTSLFFTAGMETFWRLYDNCNHLDERLALRLSARDLMLSGLDYRIISSHLIGEHEYVNADEDGLVELLNALSPLAFTEKNWDPPVLTSELIEMHREYLKLTKQLPPLGISIDDDYRQVTERITAIQKVLIEKHPFYYKLPILKSLTLEQLVSTLDSHEMYLQCEHSSLFCYAFIAGSDINMLMYASIDNNETLILQNLQRLLQSSDATSKGATTEVEEYTRLISTKRLGSDILDYCRDKKVIYCSSIRELDFPLSLLRSGDRWLASDVVSIARVKSPVGLLRRTDTTCHAGTVVVVLLGDITDSSLRSAAKRFKKKFRRGGTVHILSNPDLSSEGLDEAGCPIRCDLAVVVGHGIHDITVEGPNRGAIALAGEDRRIHADSLAMFLRRANSSIVLSCSGGVALQGQTELGGGLLLSALSDFSEHFVLCSWDVPTSTALLFIERIVETLRENPRAFECALSDVRKSFLDMDDYHRFPINWASFEYWLR